MVISQNCKCLKPLKLFGSTKILIDNTNKTEKKYQVSNQLKSFVVQQIININKSKVLYTFLSRKSYKPYGNLLNILPNNLVFLKSYNTEIDEIFRTFTDKNGTLLQRKDKVSLTLRINKQK